jgi:hypothetical protein
MASDSRSWTEKGLDDAARAALNDGLSPSELWSLLLGVMEHRAAQKGPAALLEQWRQDRFVKPCEIDQRTLNDLDAHLLAAASSFEAIELAPLAPLGACSGVALTSQNRVVATVRGTEVVSDPTNVLALECARRLRRAPNEPVNLATSHRCTRAQAVPDVPGFAAHFRLFSLASAGRERKDHAFATSALVEQIRAHWAGLDRLERHGYSFPGRKLTLKATPAKRHLAERVAAAIPGVPTAHAELSHGYYDGLRFMIDVAVPQSSSLPLVDGGSFDWLRKLGANDKLAFVASGFGSQLAAFACRRPPAS